MVAALILCLLLIAFLGGLTIVHAPAVKAARKAKELEQGQTSASIDNVPLACEALVTRVFEQRMVDAGIMQVVDMTICDNDRCADCQPTRTQKFLVEKCAVGTCRAKGTDRWNENEMLCKKHFDQRKQDEATRKTLKSINPKKPKQITLPGGATADWPKQVPEYAAYNVMRMDSGRGAMINYQIMFTWVNEQGRVTNVKMLVPDFTHMSDDLVIYSDQNIKPVWRPPTHPGSDPVHRPMAGMSRADAIRVMREQKRKRRTAAVKSLTKYPNSSGKGPKPRGSENYYWIKEPGKSPRLVRRPNKGYS